MILLSKYPTLKVILKTDRVISDPATGQNFIDPPARAEFRYGIYKTNDDTQKELIVRKLVSMINSGKPTSFSVHPDSLKEAVEICERIKLTVPKEFAAGYSMKDLEEDNKAEDSMVGTRVLAALTTIKLRDLAKEKGIDVSQCTNKGQIIQALEKVGAKPVNTSMVETPKSDKVEEIPEEEIRGAEIMAAAAARA